MVEVWLKFFLFPICFSSHQLCSVQSLQAEVVLWWVPASGRIVGNRRIADGMYIFLKHQVVNDCS